MDSLGSLSVTKLKLYSNVYVEHVFLRVSSIDLAFIQWGLNVAILNIARKSDRKDIVGENQNSRKH